MTYSLMRGAALAMSSVALGADRILVVLQGGRLPPCPANAL